MRESASAAIAAGHEPPAIRTGLRTGDTTAAERQQLVRQPPHILITTPESLYLMVTAQRGRETLRGVRTVIVDEIHALARDRRGSHLALTLARLGPYRRRAARSESDSPPRSDPLTKSRSF